MASSGVDPLFERIIIDLEEARGRIGNIFPLHTLPLTYTLSDCRRVRECLPKDSRFSALSLAYAKAQAIETMSAAVCRQIKSQIDQIHNALAPVHILPDEIMRDIFRIACVDSINDDSGQESDMESDKEPESGNSIDDGLSSVSSLSQVSRRWRDITLGHRALWSHIEIAWPLEKQGLWLERASKYPLQLVAKYFHPICLDLLSPLSPWRSLILDGPHTPSTQVILNALHGHQSLEDLVIRDTYSTLMIQNPIPCLKHLRILDSNIPSFMFVPSNIITLKLRTHLNSHFHLFTDLLASCPQLRHLEITHFVDSAQRRIYRELNVPRLSLPLLESLRLKTNDCQDELFGFVFEFIEAPRLQNLALLYCLSCVHDPSEVLYSHAAQFFERSSVLNELILVHDLRFIRAFLSHLARSTLVVMKCTVPTTRVFMSNLQTLKIQPDHDSEDHPYEKFGDALECFLDTRIRVLSFVASSGQPAAVPPRALKKLIIPHCPVNKFHLVRRRVDELRWINGEAELLEDLYDEHRYLISDLKFHGLGSYLDS